MSNRSCEDCKWDKKGMFCLQAHGRGIKYEGLNAIGYVSIEACHAWEVKPKCWYEREGEKRMQIHDYTIDKSNLGHYQMRAVEIAQYCPHCGKKVKEEKPEC